MLPSAPACTLTLSCPCTLHVRLARAYCADLETSRYNAGLISRRALDDFLRETAEPAEH